MSDLLTTRQLMQYLPLDRTTIYRMLKDGRLSAERVGGQWRFSRQAIEAWFEGQNTFASPRANDSVEITDTALHAEQNLPLSCFQAIQEMFAQSGEIGAVTTDLGGNLLTHFSNPSAFCELVISTAEGRANCQVFWKRSAEQNDAPPHLERCHAGLTSARGRVVLGKTFVAMFLAGPFISEQSRQVCSHPDIVQVAQTCAVDAKKLEEALPSVSVLPQARVEQLLNLSQLVADSFSRITRERFDLLTRLKQVVDLARISAS